MPTHFWIEGRTIQENAVSMMGEADVDGNEMCVCVYADCDKEKGKKIQVLRTGFAPRSQQNHEPFGR